VSADFLKKCAIKGSTNSKCPTPDGTVNPWNGGEGRAAAERHRKGNERRMGNMI